MSGAGKLCLVLLTLLGSIACTERSANGSDQVESSKVAQFQQWKLPSRLKEISGLALSPDGRLFSVDDEQAVIYEIDYEKGKIAKKFALGKPVLQGDFEGIAYLDGHLLLITSDGLLYSAVEGLDGEHVSYEKTDTELGAECEIEGLTQDPDQARLLIVCKEMHDDDDELAIFVWQMGNDQEQNSGRIKLPVNNILMQLETKKLHPSGIAIHPHSRSLFIIAARQRALIELDFEGGFISAAKLPKKKRHRQPEGVEISRAGELIISDEGDGKRARLAIYSSVHVIEES
jgi:uncharacterized protein YjiK